MTISEIAKRAGVSSAAVSRYFNKGYISEEKREAIKKVVEETGYQPSKQAAMLRTKKTKQIGFIIPRIDSSSMSRVVAGVYKSLEEKGYQVVLGVTMNNPDKELDYLAMFQNKMVDGVIFSASVVTEEHKKAMKEMEVPLVVLGQKISGQYCVYHDDYNSIREMTEHVLNKGAKNPGYIGFLEDDVATGKTRSKAFMDTITEAGLSSCKKNYVVSHFSINDGYQQAKKLLTIDPTIDAILTANDRIAIGALKYVQDQGLRCPEDIMIAGHGDSITTIVTNPTISSIRVPYQESGEMAAEVLVDMIEGENKAVKEVMLGYSLIERESTGNSAYKHSWNQTKAVVQDL